MEKSNWKNYLEKLGNQKTADIIILLSMVFTFLFFLFFKQRVIIDELGILAGIWFILKSLYDFFLLKNKSDLLLLIIGIVLLLSVIWKI